MSIPQGDDVRTTVRLSSFGQLLSGDHDNPLEVLGPRVITENGSSALAVRAFLPKAKQAWVIHSAHAGSSPMRRIHPAGLFEAVCPLPQNALEEPYQLRIDEDNGDRMTVHDPYSFPSLFTEFDFYLFGEGNHTRIYDKLGAQIREIKGVRGVNFAVWAPNARGISVIGDFNEWDSRRHPMKKHIPNGIWEIFVPGLNAGEKYKFRMKQANGDIVEKQDPYGFATELPPRTASIVVDPTQYQWSDQRWVEQRQKSNYLNQPISVYEVHLGSWKHDKQRENGWMNYRDIAHQLVDYCKRLGFTHVELLPISEHPFTGSWGYQTVGYYAVTSRYGTPEDFMYFVDYCHQHDIGVIVDWVPAHFPKDNHGLRRFDGTALFEHEDPRQGEHPDWGTLIFNYGRNEIRNFLTANALFWLERYHIDGLRVDAVASMLYLDYSRKEGEWIPNQYGGRENLEAISFLKQFNERVHADHPGVLTIAEESTAWPKVSRPLYDGGLGFSLKWNMGWMNDSLRYLRNEPVHRQYHHDEITFSLIYAFTENFMLPLSHDEVVHGKKSLLSQMPGDTWQKFANLRLLYSYMWSHPGKKLLFMGSELGDWEEWNYNKELPWNLAEYPQHSGIQNLLGDLNKLYREERALHELDFDGAGFEWIDCLNRSESVLVYERRSLDQQERIIVCCNLTPVVRQNYKVGVSVGGYYQEIFNSDSHHYGGSNVGNFPGKKTELPGHHMRPHRLDVTLPPLATVMFKYQGEKS